MNINDSTNVIYDMNSSPILLGLDDLENMNSRKKKRKSESPVTVTSKISISFTSNKVPFMATSKSNRRRKIDSIYSNFLGVSLSHVLFHSMRNSGFTPVFHCDPTPLPLVGSGSDVSIANVDMCS